MSELTFKSAGVSTREIDLSQPTRSGPQGVPAGIIGTALSGPAFVPITVSNFTEFESIFGATDGEKFGPIAVNQWLSSAKACTYIRLLGVGDGKKRNDTTGVVTNAGYIVGDQQIQANGTKDHNPFANHGDGTIKGRTYFLGCFMSESNGSTVFSDAGIQSKPANVHAIREDLIELTGLPPNNHTIEFVIPAGYGDDAGKTINVVFVTSLGTPGANNIQVLRGADAAETAERFIKAVNGGTWGSGEAGVGANGTICRYHSNFVSVRAISGLQAIAGSTSAKVTIRAGIAGSLGNSITVRKNATNVTFSPASPNPISLANGADTGHAVPILRGILLAPSGVILHLSGNKISANNNTPGDSSRAAASNNKIMGQRGGVTGSLHISSQQFTLLMNGFKGSADNLTCITASFDMTSPDYISKVLNTDPFKIEEKGHLLYGHYDIHPKIAAVTGSGAVTAGHASEGSAPAGTYSTTGLMEDIAFLLTGSKGRGETNLVNVPDYEDFRDRFSHAETPFFISQNDKKLFKLVALSPGKDISNDFKVSIERIRPSTSTTNKFGKFDLVIRNFNDTDVTKSTIESFRSLSLDPTSDRYIARAIGDLNTFYDFDSNPESQKIIVEGSHPVKSRFVRVVVSDDVAFGNIDETELPVGFRGPQHLVTSGTLLCTEKDSTYFKEDLLQRVVEPPIPYRRNLTIGVGVNKKIDNRFHWGVQFSQLIDPSDPNKVAGFDNSFNTYVKHFPNHRKDTSPFAVKDSTNSTLVNGTMLNNDLFNKNKFSLLNIKVITGSGATDGADLAANPDKWEEAVYVRGGGIVKDDATKTRAFRIEDLKTVANRKYAKFTTLFQGGFNGVDIFNKDKQNFTNNAVKREMDDANQKGTADSTIAAYRKAIDIMGSKSDVDIQILATPGIRHPSVTDFAIDTVENRFDALYIMDIEERDQLNDVVTSSVQQVHVANTIIDFKNRGLDTSFAATYFPNVTVVDPTTNALVDAPPSVAVLGAIANNDRVGHPWFAPAGFARGGLAGVETESVKLSRENLDDLYDSDINPITSFPSTGVTIWGQKTLQQDSSALDRINVRRLLIDIRRKVRNVANSLLFEPNREETLEKFTGLVNPILQRVQTLSGVDRYKVVIDTSTTTQADVENNTIRGKIFLQPTRTVEFVALDFVVTNAGSDLL